MHSQTVVKLKRELQPPKEWGDEPVDHVYCDRANPPSNQKAVVSMYRNSCEDPWIVSAKTVQAIRPPDHPGHPNNWE